MFLDKHRYRPIHRLGLRVLPEEVVRSYLASLYFDEEHSGAWSDHDERELYIQKKSAQAGGFKLMYNTLSRYPVLKDYLMENRDIRIIHLVRENLLKTYISRERLRLTGMAHATTKSMQRMPIRFSGRAFERYMRQQLRHRNAFRALFGKDHQYLETSYEELFRGDGSVVSRLLDFLAVPAMELQAPGLKKMSTDNIRDEVENWQEVLAWCASRGQEKLLDDFIY